MSRKTFVTFGGLFSSLAILLIMALIFLNASDSTAGDEKDDQVWIADTLAPTLAPLVLTEEVTATPFPSPTDSQSPTDLPPATETPIPPTEEVTVYMNLVPTVEGATPLPYTGGAVATLPVEDWTGAGGGVSQLPAGVNTTGRCVGVTKDGVYVNIRDYPGLSAGVQGTIYPNQAYEVIAVAIENDALWYGLEKGWVAGSVVDIYGDTCYLLPNASVVAWRSFGHVDFASTSKYRPVKNLKVERYMLNYPMLIFDNGTIWYNPNGWGTAN